MVEALAIVAFLLWCAAAVCVAIARHDNRQRSAESLRAELLHADHQVAIAHRQARRAMNDAAGQSWRNLAG